MVNIIDWLELRVGICSGFGVFVRTVITKAKESHELLGVESQIESQGKTNEKCLGC
jgi:hypothetical protein